jgi:hypothetical protein|nr:MAG TPA: ASCH domain protein [Caudoviricetes sp.]DAS18780.1 MAG TPA: ASCH domain protein [Caudoviricetes sp.]
MKKIFFNDKYCLTQAVLDGTKTMTRRVLKEGTPLGNWEEMAKYLPYKIGEVVAIAQSYNDVYNELEEQGDDVANDWWLPSFEGKVLDTLAGYKNKMFVRSDFMKHHIKITDVKVEYLQDISDDEVLREGIYPQRFFNKVEYVFATMGKMNNTPVHWLKTFPTPREAFAALIDKISGKGMWESNPWVAAYSFELID